MKRLLTIAVLAIAFASCKPSYEKTQTGLSYKIFKGDKGEKLKHGQLVKINGEVKLSGKDSILFTTFGRMPEYLMIDTSRKRTHDFSEVLQMASVGDSLIVISQIDTLVKMGIMQYNEMFKKGDQIKTTVKVLGVFENEEARAKDQQAETEKIKSKELAELESYLKKNNIKTTKTPNGVFVEITNPGEGEKVKAGNQVTVMYKGSLVENGKVFDANTESEFGHTDPFSFVVGAGQVIRGWDEGLQYFSKGGSGNLYIPSMMGYGPSGSAPSIPPFAALKFEVSVKDVTTPPAPAAPPAPPAPPAK